MLQWINYLLYPITLL